MPSTAGSGRQSMKRKRRRAGRVARSMALLSGMDLRQIALLVGAVLGSGGLVKLDAGRKVSATDQRTTATAPVAVAALEEIAALRDDLEVLRRDVRRLRRRELPVSD